MVSERVYRRLLAVYPKEHRQEYGELMVQLFRDRMRRDGGGFRKMTVWTQMILDLTVSAFKEHKEETDMKKRMFMGTALAIALLAVATGVGAIMAQSKGEVTISVSRAIHTYEAGEDGITGALRQAVEEGVLDQEGADQIAQAFSESPPSANGEPAVEMAISTKSHSYTFEAGEDGIAETLRQAVEDGEIPEEIAYQISIAGAPSSSDGDSAWHRYSFSGANGFADALQQAVEEGVISQEIADEMMMRMRSSKDESAKAGIW